MRYICDCADIVSSDGFHDDVNDADDDVELLAVDSPLRSSNQSRRPRRLGGILRLRSSDDELQRHDDDDALLSLERELTRSMFTYLFVYLLFPCNCSVN